MPCAGFASLCYETAISIQKFLYSDVMKPHKYYRHLLHRFGHLPKVLNLFIYLFIFICVYHVYSMVFIWRLENNFQVLVLSFCQVGSGDQTQVLMLRGKSPYLPSLHWPLLYFWSKHIVTYNNHVQDLLTAIILLCCTRAHIKTGQCLRVKLIFVLGFVEVKWRAVFGQTRKHWNRKVFFGC